MQEQGSVLREQLVALALLGLMVVGIFSLLTTSSLATQMAHKHSPWGGSFVYGRSRRVTMEKGTESHRESGGGKATHAVKESAMCSLAVGEPAVKRSGHR